jgi:HlyD family secretion protein
MMAIKIINPDYLQVKLDVKEVDVLKIKQGQEVEVTGDAFPDKKFKGFVKSVGTVAMKKQGISNSDEAFIQVIGFCRNTEKVLKPGTIRKA